MFDESVMDQSNMDVSDMSIDIGNLSTIFGGGSGSKNTKNKLPEAIKEMDEEEEDGRK